MVILNLYCHLCFHFFKSCFCVCPVVHLSPVAPLIFNVSVWLEVLSELHKGWGGHMYWTVVVSVTPGENVKQGWIFQTQWTYARLLKDEHSPKYSEEFHELVRDKRHPSHSTVCFSLCPHTAGPADRWMDEGGCWGWGGGSWVTFLPSRLCVCQPGHSQFSPGKLGGKNFLYVSMLDAATTTQRPVCTQSTFVCVCVWCLKLRIQCNMTCMSFSCEYIVVEVGLHVVCKCVHVCGVCVVYRVNVCEMEGEIEMRKFFPWVLELYIRYIFVHFTNSHADCITTSEKLLVHNSWTVEWKRDWLLHWSNLWPVIISVMTRTLWGTRTNVICCTILWK